jgi:hypothetical protein
MASYLRKSVLSFYHKHDVMSSKKGTEIKFHTFEELSSKWMHVVSFILWSLYSCGNSSTGGWV